MATSTTIPILDLEPYMRGDPGAMEDAAARLRQINETVGFLYIVNHGVDRGLVDRTFEQAERFHAQPLDRKLAAKVNTAMQGYLPVRGSTTRTSTLSTGNKPNENEAFFIKRSGDDAGPGEVWPQGLDGFRETALAVATVPLRMTRSKSGMKRPPVARGPPRCEQSACRRPARGHPQGTPRPVRPTGEILYRVERPWGDLPLDVGAPSDVACDTEGRVFCLLRRDPYPNPPAQRWWCFRPAGGGSPRGAAGRWRTGTCSSCTRMAGCSWWTATRTRSSSSTRAASASAASAGGTGRGNRSTRLATCPLGQTARSTSPTATALRWSTASRPGGGCGEIPTPHSFWVLADGRVAVADRENDRVQVFTAEGGFLYEWRGHHRPMSVHGGPGGTLCVTDQVPRLSLLGPDGALLGRCRPVLNGAHGMWRAGRVDPPVGTEPEAAHPPRAGVGLRERPAARCGVVAAPDGGMDLAGIARLWNLREAEH